MPSSENARTFELAIEEATEAIEGFSAATQQASTRGAGGGGGGLGAARAGRGGAGKGGKLAGLAGKAGVVGMIAGAVASGVQKTGLTQGLGAAVMNGGSISGNLQLSVLQAGAQNLPGPFGQLVAEISQPVQAGMQRTSQIAQTIARAGGEIDDDLIKGLNKRFVGEEARARNARRQVQRVGADQASALIGQSAEGSRLAELVDSISGLRETIESFNPFGGSR